MPLGICHMFPKVDQLDNFCRLRWEFVTILERTQLVHIGCQQMYYFQYPAKGPTEIVCIKCRAEVPKGLLVQAKLLDALGTMVYV